MAGDHVDGRVPEGDAAPAAVDDSEDEPRMIVPRGRLNDPTGFHGIEAAG
ncbi:MAG: hypothetical protein P4L82_01030 [Ancalomicrobiaceae bacterium]|nr:hypothetical protein [Ancalomicrobiaceae bacterium]